MEKRKDTIKKKQFSTIERNSYGHTPDCFGSGSDNIK